MVLLMIIPKTVQILAHLECLRIKIRTNHDPIKLITIKKGREGKLKIKLLKLNLTEKDESVSEWVINISNHPVSSS